jgi:hypothetical protein
MKPKGYFVIQGAALLETDGGSNLIRVGNQAFNITT